MYYWGYHLLLDCTGCSNIDDKDTILAFVKAVCERIGMTPHGDPVLEYLNEGRPNQGYSLMQMITTSNITGHFMELDGVAYIDIFSTKQFDVDSTLKVVDEYFHPRRSRLNFITRHAD
jgi:S-adenosylmethionine/arginine decarboxylase-like enzyme